MASIEDRLARDPVVWKPEPGDVLAGVVTEVDTRTSEYGTYPLVTIETDDGQEVMVHGFHTVLRSELARKQPQPGDRIGVKFLGQEPGKNYVSYRLVLERTTAPDWTAIGVDAAAEQALTDSVYDEPPPDLFGEPF